jgi:hypothetical protein
MFRDLNINLFDNDISISKGEIFLDWIREKIEQKVFGEHSKEGKRVRFKDIERDLQILTLDINTNTPFIFSKNTTPDEEIALAVRISSGLPGLMKPVNINDAILVDGDLIKSWPAWKIYETLNTSDNRMLEFRLEGSRDGSGLKNPMDYLNSVISTIWYLSTEDVYNSYHHNDRYDFVIIDAKDVILFDFTIDKDTREKLVEKGYRETKKYLLSTLPEKKKNIKDIYIKLLKKCETLEKATNHKNSENILYTINDILSDMYEDTKYIDISVYQKFKELKNFINQNTRTDFIFNKRVDNIKQIKERCEFVKMLVKERIDDINEYLKLCCNNC